MHTAWSLTYVSKRYYHVKDFLGWVKSSTSWINKTFSTFQSCINISTLWRSLVSMCAVKGISCSEKIHRAFLSDFQLLILVSYSLLFWFYEHTFPYGTIFSAVHSHEPQFKHQPLIFINALMELRNAISLTTWIQKVNKKCSTKKCEWQNSVVSIGPASACRSSLQSFLACNSMSESCLLQVWVLTWRQRINLPRLKIYYYSWVTFCNKITDHPKSCWGLSLDQNTTRQWEWLWLTIPGEKTTLMGFRHCWCLTGLYGLSLVPLFMRLLQKRYIKLASCSMRLMIENYI